jgi:hypothetical protein
LASQLSRNPKINDWVIDVNSRSGLANLRFFANDHAYSYSSFGSSRDMRPYSGENGKTTTETKCPYQQ